MAFQCRMSFLDLAERARERGGELMGCLVCCEMKFLQACAAKAPFHKYQSVLVWTSRESGKRSREFIAFPLYKNINDILSRYKPLKPFEYTHFTTSDFAFFVTYKVLS